jgi:regulator of extracellular matrix RemA (YlzA/DUF370 family)
MNAIEIPGQGFVMIQRIVAVAPATSTPIKRFLKLQSADKLLLLTGGKRRQSIIVLDSGHVLITSLGFQQLLNLSTGHLGIPNPHLNRID